eukprot:49005-Eustigmatos_ZCMA.PRE.1
MLNDLGALAAMLSLSHDAKTLADGVMEEYACWRLLTMLKRHPCMLRMYLKLQGMVVGGLEPLAVTQAEL